MRSNPVRESNAARRERLRAERIQAREIITQYRGIWQSVKSQLDDLQGRIKSAEKAGETVNRGWILKQSQLQNVQANAESEIGIASAFLEHQITRAQADAVLAGRRDAEQMIRTALGSPPPGIEWHPALPTRATAQLIGRSSDGQPLGELLSTLGPAAGKELRHVLVSGIAQGKNPRVVARDARSALGGNMARALTIARTEILGAYRASSLATYQDNADVVTSWVWSAADDACEMCMAMQGEEFDTEEEMDTHVNCRCSLIPKTKSWADLGYPGIDNTTVEVPSGEDVFAAQPDAQQLATLGPAKYAAYKSGQITLKDLVQKTYSRQWGPGRRTGSLQFALEKAKARKSG